MSSLITLTLLLDPLRQSFKVFLFKAYTSSTYQTVSTDSYTPRQKDVVVFLRCIQVVAVEVVTESQRPDQWGIDFPLL